MISGSIGEKYGQCNFSVPHTIAYFSYSLRQLTYLIPNYPLIPPLPSDLVAHDILRCGGKVISTLPWVDRMKDRLARSENSVRTSA